MNILLVIFVTCGLFIRSAFGIWCYRCVGSHPGCGMYDFDWRFYWSSECPDPNDKCVKVIEEKDEQLIVTRDCLSHLEGHRRDIPADRYEGCRTNTWDVLLGHYIFPSVPEIDHRREHYDKVTFCFCDFDERCNSGVTLAATFAFTFVAVVVNRFL